MNTTQQEVQKLFHIKMTTTHKLSAKEGLGRGRYLIGRSDSCDIYIDDESISAVHAVLEITSGGIRIYDMNSTNGTYVNGAKIIAQDVKLGDLVGVASATFKIQEYVKAEVPPPILDILEPETKLPPKPLLASNAVKTDSVVYPLASDPKAEFSEYIFEDVETLYPIFKYQIDKIAVEVIILYKGSVFSVDYLPEGKATYFLTGSAIALDDIELPCLGKTERLPFVEIASQNISIHSVPSYEAMILSDNKSDNKKQSIIDLRPNDLIRFSRGDIQIFVRSTQAPPKVAAAPLLKRDPNFQKFLVLFMAFVALFSVGIQFVNFDDAKEEEIEKAPERLAQILYKQKLTVSKHNTIEKTENAPMRPQMAPDRTAVQKTSETKVQPEVKNPDVMNIENKKQIPDPGSKNAQEKKEVLKGDPKAKPTPKQAAAKATPTNKNTGAASNKPQAYSRLNQQSPGPVDVYKSADFSTSVNSVLAKGGSLAGARSEVYGSSGNNIGSGAISGATSGSGDLKKAEVSTNFGSLTGSTTGVIGTSKGAEGLASKRAIYTAGIPSDTVVLGSMDPDVIRRLLMAHLPQFRSCYQNELDRTGNEIQGAIKLDFTIGASGRVANAGVEGAQGLPGSVKGCVVNVLRGIQFPEPQGGGTVEVNQQMNFYPKKI